jgi:hypothetical protein
MMKTIQKPVTLSDGVIIEPSDRANTGYKHSSFNTNIRQFLSWVKKEPLEQIDKRVNVVQGGSSPTFTLGWFDDAREAAYAAAYFQQNTEELLKKYFKQVTKEDVRTGRAQLFRVIGIDFPKDLYDLPEVDPDSIDGEPRGNYGVKNKEIEKTSNLEKIKQGQSKNSAEDTFIEFLQSNSEIKNALSNIPADERQDARDMAIDRIMKGADETEVVSYLTSYLNESKKRAAQKVLSESKKTLGRIKYLAGLK